MAKALIRIEKSVAGKPFANTYAVITTGLEDSVLGAGDWEEMSGDDTTIDASTTLPGDPSYAGTTSLVHALLGWERLMCFTSVLFTRLFVWDGLKNPTDESSFKTVPLAFHGLKSPPAGDDNNMAPGNVSLLIAKEPAAFGKRTGHIFLKFTLTDQEIAASGERLLDWATPANAAAAAVALAANELTSSLTHWLNVPIPYDRPVLAIPQYYPKGHANHGQLKDANAIKSLRVVRPNGRQVQRGRRRPAA